MKSETRLTRFIGLHRAGVTTWHQPEPTGTDPALSKRSPSLKIRALPRFSFVFEAMQQPVCSG